GHAAVQADGGDRDLAGAGAGFEVDRRAADDVVRRAQDVREFVLRLEGDVGVRLAHAEVESRVAFRSLRGGARGRRRGASGSGGRRRRRGRLVVAGGEQGQQGGQG